MTSPTRTVASLRPADIWFLLMCCGGQVALFTAGIFAEWHPALSVLAVSAWTFMVLAGRRAVTDSDD